MKNSVISVLIRIDHDRVLASHLPNNQKHVFLACSWKVRTTSLRSRLLSNQIVSHGT